LNQLTQGVNTLLHIPWPEGSRAFVCARAVPARLQDDRHLFLLQARRRNTLNNHARRLSSSGAHP
jgi:hypothetical protein